MAWLQYLPPEDVQFVQQLRGVAEGPVTVWFEIWRFNEKGREVAELEGPYSMCIEYSLDRCELQHLRPINRPLLCVCIM